METAAGPIARVPPPPERRSAPAAAGAPAPAARAGAVERRKVTRRTVDVENELARLRHDALSTPAAGARAGGNGRGELSRSIALTLNRADFARARRVSLSLAVEDADNRVVDSVRGLKVELDPRGNDPEALRQVLLNLRIALSARE